MTIILSLQGSMAVGKTTAAKYVEKITKDVFVSYENPLPIIKQIKNRGLNKDVLNDFVEIQRMFINAEINRWSRFKKYPVVLTDLGAMEIEFYTLFYPVAMNYNWDIENIMGNDLNELRKCRSDKVLFLEASQETLYRNKKQDVTRRRRSFDFYVNNLLDLKRDWFRGKENVDFLNCDGLNSDKLCRQVNNWVQKQRDGSVGG